MTAAVKEMRMSEWQPIGTARAGHVLVTDGIRQAVAHRFQDSSWGPLEWVWRPSEPHSRGLTWDPTHWMPLPEPPE